MSRRHARRRRNARRAEYRLFRPGPPEPFIWGTGWDSDPLYARILSIRREPTVALWLRGWDIRLFEEWSDADDHPSCRGRPLRAWELSDEGPRPITAERHAELATATDGLSRRPFAVLRFQIRPDRRRVVVNLIAGPLAGRGFAMLVEGTGEGATLRIEPGGPGWIA